jgi:hypothetical protein
MPLNILFHITSQQYSYCYVLKTILLKDKIEPNWELGKTAKILEAL